MIDICLHMLFIIPLDKEVEVEKEHILSTLVTSASRNSRFGDMEAMVILRPPQLIHAGCLLGSSLQDSGAFKPIFTPCAYKFLDLIVFWLYTRLQSEAKTLLNIHSGPGYAR